MTNEPPSETIDAEPSQRQEGGFLAGAQVILDFLRTLPSSPGVYRMLAKSGDVLYVGKAKNLKKRVIAYTRAERLPLRLQRMVAGTASMEVVTTHTEVEALLLEANLIKRLAPRYNILLRDDKSFPYILITGDHRWPQIVKHRGARNRKGEYFGPFASAGAVNQTLSHLQRAFLLRSCTDTVFSTRSRPCLLHQIKRCSAPCVERIGHDDYERLVAQARGFLSGQSQAVQHELVERMEEASRTMAYEEAAVYRDRIRALARISAHQDINPLDIAEADVVALHQAGGQACIQVFFFRSGCNFGNRSFFPAQTQDQSAEDILAAFLAQFYDDKIPPREILLSHPLKPDDAALLIEALSLKAGRKVALGAAKRGDRRKMIEHAYDNAREALGRRMAESSAQAKLLAGVADLFGLDAPPRRIEVYDNSHIQGTNAVGGMIVAGPEGFLKNEYRKFNIASPDLSPGDDFGMMREVLSRRFRRAQKEDPDRERGNWPDLVLIDGGPGQLKVAIEVLAELGIGNQAMVGISKGPDRNAGRERFHLPDKPPFSLPPNDPVLYFLQRLRDEAHRFAIGTHRARRSKAIGSSPLDEIGGIGAQRKKALLHHFGSARGVSEAGLTDLQAVDGISDAMARKIYDHFHPAG
ncbi:excinuclease ABC subunit UvrC [Telmatospirillum siberiense]|uniref:UvrABC system protein C n=1 Tax=Telmatospirillum siberiense TaxID=382514 RepID=A0A2N3PU88_9PROT|nr:excinuclease ABC subunit UvrC [Telmatospirillum siberiense]PKU23950.1 excinuclease ABC subunit C [Telmatospirillum siberiense]